MALRARQPAQVAELSQARAQLAAVSEQLSTLQAEKARVLLELEHSHSAAEQALGEALRWQHTAQVCPYRGIFLHSGSFWIYRFSMLLTACRPRSNSWSGRASSDTSWSGSCKNVWRKPP